MKITGSQTLILKSWSSGARGEHLVGGTKKVSLDKCCIHIPDQWRFYQQLGSVLYDARNQPILNISNKLLSLNHEYIVREGQSSNVSNSRELARIVSRVAFGDGASKMDIRFANAVDGEDIELTLEGDWTNRQVVSFRCLKIAF